MFQRLGPLGKLIFALIIGLFLGWIIPVWLSSWRESTATVVFVVVFHFLLGLIVGVLTRGPKASAAVITFAVSFLGWPAWNGFLCQFEGWEFYGALEVVPALIGGFFALVARTHVSRHR